MPQWLSEAKGIKRLPNGRKRVLYVDNCPGHSSTPQSNEAVNIIITELRYFEPTITDYVQPCDSFDIQKSRANGQLIRKGIR